MIEARSSETSVDIQLKTRQFIPEDCEVHTRRRDNLKSHIILTVVLDIVHRLGYLSKYDVSATGCFHHQVKVGESDAYCGMFCLQTEVIPVT
jgi:hypothetical protein